MSRGELRQTSAQTICRSGSSDRLSTSSRRSSLWASAAIPAPHRQRSRGSHSFDCYAHARGEDAASDWNQNHLHLRSVFYSLQTHCALTGDIGVVERWHDSEAAIDGPRLDLA